MLRIAEKKYFRFLLYEARRLRNTENALGAILYLFGDVVIAAPHTNLFICVLMFFFQCKYRNYSSKEIQWIRECGNESSTQERTNQVSQFRNDSTAEGILFMTAISGIFLLVQPEALSTLRRRNLNTQQSPFIKWFWICGGHGKLGKRNYDLNIMISRFTESAGFFKFLRFEGLLRKAPFS